MFVRLGVILVLTGLIMVGYTFFYYMDVPKRIHSVTFMVPPRNKAYFFNYFANNRIRVIMESSSSSKYNIKMYSPDFLKGTGDDKQACIYDRYNVSSFSFRVDLNQNGIYTFLIGNPNSFPIKLSIKLFYLSYDRDFVRIGSSILILGLAILFFSKIIEKINGYRLS